MSFWLLAAALLLPSLARASSAGRPGELYSFGASARGLAMGGAHTALVNDVTSVYYNPAGLGMLPAREVSFMRANLFGDATYDYIGYAQNKKKRAGGWGFEVIRLGAAGDDGRDELNNKSGGFAWSETSLGLAHGWRGLFHPALSFGLKGKMLTRSLGSASDRMIGADMGVQAGPFNSGRLMLGAVVQNAFSMVQGDTDDKLEPVIRAGASYKVIGPLMLTGDVSADGEFRVGTEYAFGFAALRAGIEDRQLSFGGGMKFRSKYSFDLAILSHPVLGMSQRLSYLANGQAELNKRDYLRASKDLETALGIDPNVGDGSWKERAARLRKLVKALDLENHPEDQEALKQDSPAAFMAFQVIGAWLDGEEDRAMLLAHATAGTINRHGGYRRLLESMAVLTGRKVDRDAILPPARLATLRMKQGVDSIYQRRFAPAVEALREALWLEPNNAVAWTRLGSAYFAMGDKPRAGAAWKKALEINPADEKLKTFMAAQGIE
ncbi:MAG: hypothetical protein FD126_384 [Elusimicrobia bacterium]|nr:MAG: hypothetical protein FD126_384 [Elusimicrobiota bacterium]